MVGLLLSACTASSPVQVDSAPVSEPSVARGRAPDASVAAVEPSPMETPEEEAPDCSARPSVPTPLPVEGFAEASHVGPEAGGAMPAPVTVVLHGNFDRPEWECETWASVAGFRGWVVCPRGVPTPWAEPSEDRWTYKGRPAVEREIEAALVALEERYPGCVSRDELVLAGFSLGGIMAPGLAVASPGKYRYLFLAEGGTKKLDKRSAKALARAGVRGVGLAMSAPGRRSRAVEAVKVLKKNGIGAIFVDMRGAGHGYRADFTETGRTAMASLLAEGERMRDGGVE